MEISDNEYGKGLILDGRYRLTEPLGAGGMGVVWRAHDHVLDRSVAVKLVAPEHAGDRHSRERIRHEARAAAALAHPNVAQVYDYGETDQHGRLLPYVVMELVPGGTLHRRMSAGPVAPAFAMRVCAEIAAALSAAHAEGLVHRDIKPGNVMLAPSGAKVVDFGIAAAVDPAGAEEPDDELLGTPAYLAPERLVGSPVVPASDVYALGVVLYVLLSGHSPWTAENTRQMLTAHVYVEPATLPPLPGVPAHVVELCNRCLAKDPAARPGAQQVAAELGEAAGLRVVTDEPPAPPAAVPEATTAVLRVVSEEPGPAADRPAVAQPASRRTPLLVVAGALGLAVVAGGLVWLRLGDPGDLSVVAAESLPPVARPPAGVSPGGSRSPEPKGSARTGRSPVSEPGVPVPVGTTTPAVTVGTSPPQAAPRTPTTTPATPTTPPATAAVTRTLSSGGGTVTATCPSDATAELLSWTPARTYKVDEVDPGPGPAPAVSFKHGSSVITMTVACSDGVPTASTS
ncbi:hypothetical protein Acy02nite_01510 [Actinoplanes cyaneus]|uniref:non-specific serine/threonine protein kinase n=1 Tax=Actinoplanes cyaneus TaxID=52696 RepID=A0A919LXU2_9ACTN|nr:serine/threonine-protein kinase [Actinoplanes cyaneus]MCW2142719.1 serine/threonine protein kinase [Actinoplanes cyaneus]GID62270.1 hypothetical protein Acy02nite_01510 [Actinoplanes cyaneus]